MNRKTVLTLLSIMIMSGTVVQTTEAIQVAMLKHSQVRERDVTVMKTASAIEKTQHPELRPHVEPKPSVPDPPAPNIDPEIVQEPPIPPDPDAIVVPPKLDPEMTVNPRTLPGYPDFPHDESEGFNVDRNPREELDKAQPK